MHTRLVFFFLASPTFCQTNDWYRYILIGFLALRLCSVACSSLTIVALIENSVMSRWVPPHHFPCAVGGRVYFRLSGVYVNEKRTGLLADRWLHRIGSLHGFEVYLMGTTLSTNQLQQKCARWLFNFLGEVSAPRPVVCEGAQHPLQNRF